MDFSQISTLLVAAAIFGLLARLLKQPLFIGYLFAGFFLSLVGVISDTNQLQSLSQIGVTLLLFILGLEMNIGELPSIGKVALITGLGQVVITFISGLLISLLIGFGFVPSLFLGVALSFSSTIIVVKLLAEKKDLSSLYGKLAIGILLVQDFFAISFLVFLSGIEGGGFSYQNYLLTFIKAFGLISFVWFVSKKFIPKIFEKLTLNSQEMMFILSIAWVMGFSYFVHGPLGFSLEIGGFLAGLALSNLPEQLEIGSRMRPLRDFFLTLFFILLGSQLAIGDTTFGLLAPAMLFSIFVLIVHPLSIMSILGFLGYRKRTSFFTGLTNAQISEFSFIIMSVGLSLGYIDSKFFSLVIIIGAITMTTSSYLIFGAEKLYKKISKYLSIFERDITKEGVFIKSLNYNDHVVLIGCDRTGKSLLKYLVKKGYRLIVVDFNPNVYKKLTAEKIECLFGDIEDPEILNASNLRQARIVISTISNFSDNMAVLEYIRGEKRPLTLMTAAFSNDALRLYEAGANYVIVPSIIAGEHMRHIIKSYGTKGERLIKAGHSHFKRLTYM